MGRLDGERVMLMPIGKFSKASRLSVKSLRNYDESGLLPAAYVDPQSGYRYYRLEQLARADAIRSLRMVDMSLPLIAATLDGEDPEQVLMSHLEALEDQRNELDRMAQQLRRRINRKEYTMSNTIALRSNPTVTVAAHRTVTTYAQIFNDIPAGFGAVMGALASAEVDPAGIPFTIFHQAPDGDTDGEISLCVPVRLDAADTIDGADLVEIPAETTAVVVHRGSYEDMGESYATAATWVHERGHQIVGPCREVYLNSPGEVAEDELLTEIHFPIDAEPGDVADAQEAS